MPAARDVDPAAAMSRLITDAVARAARQGRRTVPKTAKNTFSLADFQTPFRSQGDRGTSWAFAGAAALEAAYKRRYGISLTLSAEYIFHIGRAFELFPHPPDPCPRGEAFLSHFPGCGAVAQLLAQCAVPDEAHAPYFATMAALERGIEVPGSRGQSEPVSQEAIDEFDFGEEHIPLRARLNARYRAADWASLGADPSVTAIENTLLAEYEVIADVFHKCDPVGAHVVLIIGFDRNQQVFLAKSSWGENAFIQIDYRDDPEWDICSGFYLVDVRDPKLVQHEAAWLGHWRMSIKGRTGRLLLRRHCDFRDPTHQPTLGTFHADGGELEVHGRFKDGGRTLNMVLVARGQEGALGTLAGGEILARLSMPGGRTAEGVMRNGSPVLLSRPPIPPLQASLRTGPCDAGAIFEFETHLRVPPR
jgi:hypothetical protein